MASVFVLVSIESTALNIETSDERPAPWSCLDLLQQFEAHRCPLDFRYRMRGVDPPGRPNRPRKQRFGVSGL